MTTIEEIRSRPTIRVEEAAQTLGISRSSAYEAVRLGHLPSLRLGRRILIPTARFLALLEDVATDSGNAKAPAAHTEAPTNSSDSPAQGEICDHLSPAR